MPAKFWRFGVRVRFRVSAPAACRQRHCGRGMRTTDCCLVIISVIIRLLLAIKIESGMKQVHKFAVA